MSSDHVVATWPGGWRAIRVSLDWTSRKGHLVLIDPLGGRSHLWFRVKSDQYRFGSDLQISLHTDTTQVGVDRIPRTIGEVSVPAISQEHARRLLWLVLTTLPAPDDPGEVPRDLYSLGYPLQAPLDFVEEARQTRELSGGNTLGFDLSSRSGFFLRVHQSATAIWVGSTPSSSALRYALAWRLERGMSVEWPGERILSGDCPAYCVQGPSLRVGSLISFGDTIEEALRNTPFLIWPGDEAEWERRWLEPGDLTFDADLFRMFGDPCPIWWSQERFEEWVGE